MKTLSLERALCGLLSTLFCAAACLAADPGAAANTNASPNARAVLKYFHDISRRTDKRLVSGQFTDFGPGASLRLMEDIHTKTGHWPGLLGADYADFGKGGLLCDKANAAAIAWWRQGGLVTISAHLYNPANPKGGGLRDKGVDLATLLEPGETHDRWMRELDQLAAGLRELKDAGVVVLWRPFHEMNGNWFWWGGQDPAAFVKVWRHMFDYFSNTQKLDNLLWVYGPNHGEKTAAYYAGDAYVDLTGLDAYTDFIDVEHIKGYSEVAALGKPFGFTEYGPHGPQNPPGDYDYRRFGAGIEKDFPATCFFMSWNGKWSLARNTYEKELLENPLTINREDLPKGLWTTTAPVTPAGDKK